MLESRVFCSWNWKSLWFIVGAIVFEFERGNLIKGRIKHGDKVPVGSASMPLSANHNKFKNIYWIMSRLPIAKQILFWLVYEASKLGEKHTGCDCRNNKTASKDLHQDGGMGRVELSIIMLKSCHLFIPWSHQILQVESLHVLVIDECSIGLLSCF